ncbi:general substrate transporter [Cubamyces sp. BRFM 1775]|nr:general substrate transporter [Cubamyces sp. BRFM 1775]
MHPSPLSTSPIMHDVSQPSIHDMQAPVLKQRISGVSMAAFSAFGGILLGYDTGTIAGILQMKSWLRAFGKPVGAPTAETLESPHFVLHTAIESVVVSMLFAGTFFGALLAAPTADILGRRTGIMLSCIVFCLGVALQAGASSSGTALPTFILGRFFAGVGVGLISTLIPMYQSECAPKWIRGAVISCYQWAVTIGIVLASVTNNATKDRPGDDAWQIPICVQFVWATVLFVGMLWLPESPRWLVGRGRLDAAVESLSRLTGQTRDCPRVESELHEIHIAINSDRVLGQHNYKDCFRPSRNKAALRTLTSTLVLVLQQLTGIVFVFSYGTTFFANVGVRNPFLVQVAVNVVQMGMTIPGIWGVEKLGRRPLLLWGASVMCICAYLVALLGVTTSVHDIAPQRAVIALVCVYIAAYAATWGPVGWVVPNEIIPLSIRAKAMSLSVAVHWLSTWVVSFASPYLVNSGPGDAELGIKIFFIWGSTAAVCILFTYVCVPETKGLSLEEIDVLYTASAVPMRNARSRYEALVRRSGASSAVESDAGSSESQAEEKAVDALKAGERMNTVERATVVQA